MIHECNDVSKLTLLLDWSLCHTTSFAAALTSAAWITYNPLETSVVGFQSVHGTQDCLILSNNMGVAHNPNGLARDLSSTSHPNRLSVLVALG